jgi:hypothetical protein
MQKLVSYFTYDQFYKGLKSFGYIKRLHWYKKLKLTKVKFACLSIYFHDRKHNGAYNFSVVNFKSLVREAGMVECTHI